ncbi:hypothetical protein [Kitasatospora sp. NPDC058218]|uniref:hypothetical protein n=1 Tax=Kitasatospora sp. NPDC058218 TaxID=3346385 RepID=UPI0036DC4622
MTDEILVRGTAERFRAALVQIRPNLDPRDWDLGGFIEFPDSSCEDSSTLLAVYFAESGLGAWEVVSGGSPDVGLGSHAWVEQDGLIVDITASQQEWPNPDVWLTSRPGWHDQFNETNRAPAEIREELAELYLRLKRLAHEL